MKLYQSIILLFSLFCLTGCRSASQINMLSSHWPGPQARSNTELIEQIQKVEAEIIEYLIEIDGFENDRNSFAKYYMVDEEGWTKRLERLPDYKKTRPFPYPDYLEQRQRLRDDLRTRTSTIWMQNQHMREDLTTHY